MADCLIMMSAISLSSTSIQSIGEEIDILEDIMLMLLSFSSLSRKSIAAIFLSSLYWGWFRSSLLMFSNTWFRFTGFRPTLFLAVCRIDLSLSSYIFSLVLGLGLKGGFFGLLEGLDGPLLSFATMLVYVMINPAGSGLSWEMLWEVLEALSLEMLSMRELMSFTLLLVVDMFLFVVVNFVSRSWIMVFVLSVWLENSVWFPSRVLSFFQD